MFNRVLTSVFGSRNERLLRQLGGIVKKINALEPQMQALSDAELQAKTPEFQQRIAKGESLDKILPEAFAVCREASQRVLGMRHYDVQLIGGMVLHMGKIAEMRTGEGKTLVATLPVYLNALEGKGVHVVTVNDYLARRDAAWMGKLYTLLGLSVGVVYPGMPHHATSTPRTPPTSPTAPTTNSASTTCATTWRCPRTSVSSAACNYAIVDEVDSILIDEARTPLIISGPADESPELYIKVNRIVPQLTRQKEEEGEGDYWVDEKGKQVHLSEAGQEHAEQLLREAGIIDERRQPVRAAQHPRRAPPQRRRCARMASTSATSTTSCATAKSSSSTSSPAARCRAGAGPTACTRRSRRRKACRSSARTRRSRSITFQNLFRMYKKLSGMTGTADTEAYEFQSIYGLEVVVIPTNRPMVRKDHSDQVFLNRNGKYRAVVKEIKDAHARQQPVLVGTTSIEVSEMLQRPAAKARRPARSAQRQAARARGADRRAGRPPGRGHHRHQHGRPRYRHRARRFAGSGARGAGSRDRRRVDAATKARMKAEWQQRHDAVKAAGGLHIVGTERHESRRIDNQLRGRSGRQGDPGSSRFYLSLEDNLMRIFAADWVQRVDGAHGHEGRRHHRKPAGQPSRSTTRSARSRRTTSTSARTCSTSTTSTTTSAR